MFIKLLNVNNHEKTDDTSCLYKEFQVFFVYIFVASILYFFSKDIRQQLLINQTDLTFFESNFAESHF